MQQPKLYFIKTHHILGKYLNKQVWKLLVFLFLLFINRYLETQLLTVTFTTRLVDSFAMCTQQNFLLQPPMQHCQQLIDFVVQTADLHNVHRRISLGYPLPTKFVTIRHTITKDLQKATRAHLCLIPQSTH